MKKGYFLLLFLAACATDGDAPLAPCQSCIGQASPRAAPPLDEQEREVISIASPRTLERMDRGDPLTINDVMNLSQAAISDDTIIAYMQETRSVYHLTQTQVRRMQEAGVSSRVIHYMLDTREQNGF